MAWFRFIKSVDLATKPNFRRFYVKKASSKIHATNQESTFLKLKSFDLTFPTFSAKNIQECKLCGERKLWVTSDFY